MTHNILPFERSDLDKKLGLTIDLDTGIISKHQ